MSIGYKLSAFTVSAALVTLTTVGADSAPSDQITFKFTGRVTKVYGSVFDQSIRRGTVVTGSYTFDSETFKEYTETSVSYIGAPVAAVGKIHNQLRSSFTSNVGNYTFKSKNFYIHVANNATQFSDYDFYVVTANMSSPAIKDHAMYSRLLLFDSTANALSSDQLPLTPPNLSKFEYKNFGVFVKDRAELAYFTATIDSIELATVPEPTPHFGVLAFGALGAASVLKRKQKPVSSVASNV